jgi:inorganic phosphate transporter, PiT family
MGAGAAKSVSAVRWGVAGNIVIAWILTLPAAGLIGALVYGLATAFGFGATGPLLITLALLGAFAVVIVRRTQQAGPAPAPSS